VGLRPKLRRRTFLLTGLAMASGIGPAAAQVLPHPSAGRDKISAADAREIARDAYIFAYPLVLYYRTMYRQAIDAKSPYYAGGFGRWGHRKAATPASKDIITPNPDTPYSCAWVDLRAEPWVLTQPPSDENRYVGSQWDDLWGFVLDCPGSILDGDKGGNYLLTAPGWKGQPPAGIKRAITGESSFLGTLTRTEQLGSDDTAAVAKIQQGYKLQPLSAYLKQPAPAAAPAVEWPVWHEGSETGLGFFGYANFLLTFTTPNPRDASMLQRIAHIGVVPGARWDEAQMDPAVRDAITAGIGDARKAMHAASLKVTDSIGLFGTRARLETDYLNRAVGVANGIFGADPQQALYYPYAVDQSSAQADGSKHAYTITFPPQGTPAARYFWSVTMYGADHFLVANPLNRYALGSHPPEPHPDPDGSVTLYLQRNPPPAARRANWLPAPNGEFFAILRIYGPDQDEVSRLWRAPPLKRVG
jgi:hypothetical protein